MWIHDLCVTLIRGNGDQRHPVVRVDEWQLIFHTRRSDDFEGPLVVTDAVDDQHVHAEHPPHVIGSRRVVVWVAPRVDEGDDIRPVAHDIRGEAVVGVQCRADTQSLRRNDG